MQTKVEEFSQPNEFDIPSTMKALVASGTGFSNLTVKQVPVPQINSDQLLARVDAAGVCTSIIKLIEQGPEHAFINGWDMKKWPIILGDEGSVTIVKVGSRLKNKYEPGQRFAIQPAVDIDPICHRERYKANAQGMHKCAVGYTLGGTLAQYIRIQEEVLQAECLLPLPDDSMPCFAVSMAEPISCVYSAQQRNYHLYKEGPHAARQSKLGLLPGGVAVIIGAGAMGRIHAEWALRFKPTILIVSDLQDDRLKKTKKSIAKKAKQAGTELHCVQAGWLAEVLNELSDCKGADDIILAVGVRKVQQQALRMLAKGGVANCFGGLPSGDSTLEVDARSVHYHEIKLVGSSGGEPSDMTATLDAIVKEQIDPGNYVAAVGSLDNAVEVLQMIENTQIDGKAILYPHIPHMPLKKVEYWSGQNESDLLQAKLQ